MFKSLINLSVSTVESVAESIPESSVIEEAGEAVQGAFGTLGEKVMFALQNSALGMLIVFAVLALLFIIVRVVSGILGATEAKKNAKKEAAPTPETETAPATAPAPVSNDGEIVAAITAAISLMLEAEGKDPAGFRVVSFRRSSTRK